MKKHTVLIAVIFFSVFLCIGALVSQTVIEQRPFSAIGLTEGMSFGTTLPTVANDGRPPFDGEPFIVRTDGSDALLRLYNESTTSWDTAPMLENTNTWTANNTYGDSEVDTFEFNGKITMNVHRQDFNRSCYVREAADGTAELVSDAAVNMAICPSGSSGSDLTHFVFRVDGAQASPFVVTTAGALDIDSDGAATEGPDIVIGYETAAPVKAHNTGTDPAAYLQVGFTIASISGTDNFQIGWRISSAFIDGGVNNTIDTGGGFHWNSNAGNCVVSTQDDTTDAEDETTACDLSDAEEMHVRIEAQTDGTFDYYFAATEALLDVATEVTKSNATGVAVAGDQLVPYITLINSDDVDNEIKILYIEIGELQ